jgi:hypothetical protein
MKRLFTITLVAFLSINSLKSQCSVTFAPTQDCSYGDQIQAFMFAGLSSTNSPGCSPAGFGNYTLTTFSAQIGATISWSSTTNGYYGYSQGFALWIDLNNNSTYEASEQIISSSPAATHSGTFTMPLGTIGSNLRMRIRSAQNSAITSGQACTNNLGGGLGETEDYRILLTCPSLTNVPVPVISMLPNNPICSGNQATLTASGLSTYTWSGGISNGVAFTPTVTSSYTVVGTIAGCPSATSTAVQGLTVTTTPTLSVNNSSICGSGTGTLTATSNANVNWYATPTSTAVLGSGNTFTALAASTTTYYADALTYGGGPAATSQTFTHTGAPQAFIVPSGITSVQIEVWGAEGGGVVLSGNTSSGVGGKGGYASGFLNVTPGSTLNVYVGGYGLSSTTGIALGGFNGGGQGYASGAGEPGNGGGGASDVRYLGNGLANRVIVAGGGGGGGEDGADPYGHGGGLTGVGYNTTFDASQTAAGAGGGLGFGGGTGNGDGGGGGGGLYGGGTFSSSTIGTDTQGGGGGSGYVGGVTGSTVLIAGNASMPNPIGTGSITGNSGHGYVRLNYLSVCQISARVPAIINVSSAPTVAVNSGSVCSGSSFTMNPTGAASYTYSSGSAVVSPTANTSYTVTGSNPGCVAVSTATSSVSVTASPTVSAVSSNTSFICVGSTATLTAAGANTYVWNTTATTAVIAVSPTTTTSYTVTGTGANGCSANAVISQSVSTCTGINSNLSNLTSNFMVYPNPSNGIFNVQLETSTPLSLATVEVTDVLGRVILTDNVKTGNYQLNLGNNVNGVYFVKAKVDGKTKTVKIVKE